MNKKQIIPALLTAVLATAVSCEKNPPAVDTVVSFEESSYWIVPSVSDEVEIPLSVSGSNVKYPVTINVNSVNNEDRSAVDEDYTLSDSTFVLNSAEDKASIVLKLTEAALSSWNSLKLNAELVISSVPEGSVGEISSVRICAGENAAKFDGVFIASYTLVGLDGSITENNTDNWKFSYYDSPYMPGFTYFTGVLGIVSDGGKIQNHIGISSVGEDGVTSFSTALGVGEYGGNTVGPYEEMDNDGNKVQYLVCPILSDMKGNIVDSGNLEFVCDGFNISLKDDSLKDKYFTYGLYGYTDRAYAGRDYKGYIKLSDLKVVRK